MKLIYDNLTLTSIIWTYKGADSDEPTAIMDKNACASSSCSAKCKGWTVMFGPIFLYTIFIVFNEDGDTYTFISGTCEDATLGMPIHAASLGLEWGPPSLKWRTSPHKGFWSEPIRLSCGINMLSNMAATVWDFPDPCTPHTSVDNGAFYVIAG